MSIETQFLLLENPSGFDVSQQYYEESMEEL